MSLPRRALVAALAAAVIPLALGTAPAASAADDRAFPTRIFSADSPFYQRLPEKTPVAWNSDTLVASLVRQSHEAYGTPTARNVDISTHRWSPTMYVARSSDPVAQYRSINCQGKWGGWDSELLGDHLSGVNVPSGAVPDDSSDGWMVVYNPDTDSVTETWVTQKDGEGRFAACWGGTIRKASTQIGQHRGYYGAAASGLAIAGTAIRADELARGHIDHVVALNIPRVKAGPSWPATRSDGYLGADELAEGQMLRLPADLDLDAMKLSPAARTVAKAAQEYGVIVTDKGGSVTFIAQHAASLPRDIYGEIFRGRWASQEMAGDPSRGEQPFPLDRLVALPLDTRIHGVAPDTPVRPSPPTPPTPPAPSTPPTPPADRRVDIRQGVRFGEPVTDATGTTWAARTPGTFDTQNVWEKPASTWTTHTARPELYRSSAWGMTHYGVDVPNGSYDVTLFMVEDWWDRPGARVFDVFAEGQPKLTNVDVHFWTGGKNRALEKTIEVTVTDGHLDLDWHRKVDHPQLSGLRITSR